jgi:hypothetical protein
MPRSALVSAVPAVDWRQLRSTYESGEVVRDIVLGLASRDETEVKSAWKQIGETVLPHQGTVYPATAAAAPLLCQVATGFRTRAHISGKMCAAGGLLAAFTITNPAHVPRPTGAPAPEECPHCGLDAPPLTTAVSQTTSTE